MSFSRPLVLIALMVMLALLIGCSGGNSLMVPGEGAKTNGTALLGLQDVGSAIETIGLLGAYECSFNPDDMTVDIVSKRLSSAVGDSFIVSGISFFAIAPCGNCLTLGGVQLDGGDPKLTFNIRHPFAPGNVTEPPTAKNRLDLDIFDLSVLVEPTGTTAITTAFGKAFYGTLVNATGYTKELAGLLADDTMLPYILIIDDSQTGTSTFNKFAMGATGKFDLKFDITGPLVFNLYLTMGYGQSAVRSGRLTPRYFNPEFNRKAAWKVAVTPPQGSDPPAKGNTWENQNTTTPYNVRVAVYDWQQGVTTIADPPVNTGDIAFASDVSSVSVSIPGMTASPIQVTTPTSGAGTPSDPVIFTVPIANANGLLPGEYVSIVKVLDERVPPTAVPGAKDVLIDSPDGIATIQYVIPEFATYQIFIATVVNSCGPIVGSIVSPTCPLGGLGNGQKVRFEVKATSGNGGDPILVYEADWDYNGVTFTVDAISTDGIFANGGPFDVPDPCVSNIPMTFKVAFRAKDSCSPQNVTIFATCDVTVENCCEVQELLYNFNGCLVPSMQCQGWVAGGCFLPNTDISAYSHFGWLGQLGTPCGMEPPYLTTGGDSVGWEYVCDIGDSANLNVVSPSLNLPSSTDGKIEFDHCNTIAPGGTARLLISTAGCTGPWTEIWSTTSGLGCNNDTTIDINTYTGSDVMFRYQYESPSFYSLCYTSDMTCGYDSYYDGGNAGIVIDNVRIFGCFNGDLTD